MGKIFGILVVVFFAILLIVCTALKSPMIAFAILGAFMVFSSLYGGDNGNRW